MDQKPKWKWYNPVLTLLLRSNSVWARARRKKRGILQITPFTYFKVESVFFSARIIDPGSERRNTLSNLHPGRWRNRTTHCQCIDGGRPTPECKGVLIGGCLRFATAFNGIYPWTWGLRDRIQEIRSILLARQFTHREKATQKGSSCRWPCFDCGWNQHQQ